MSGLTLAQKAQWKKIDEQIAENVASFQKVAGAAPEFSTNRESFAGQDMGSISTFAWAVTEGLENVVRKGADEKDAVVSTIKTIQYGFGAPSFSINGNTLVVNTDLGASNNAASVRDNLTNWIMNNL